MPNHPRLGLSNKASRNAPPQITAGLFAAVAKLGQASVRRIYGDFSGTRLRSWADTLAAHAIVPHQAFANTPGKNAFDIALVIDAMALLHTGRFDGFRLVSSDIDFTRLAARIRQQGLDVYGFGEAKTPESFRQACARFFSTETLLPQPPKAPKAARAVKAQAPEKPVATVAPETPATEPPPARIIQPVSAAVDLLHRAATHLAEGDNWASCNNVAILIREFAPGFDPKSYRCSKLSLLVAKTGQFEVRRDKKKPIFVRTLPFWANPPEADECPHHPEPMEWADQEEPPF